LREHFEGDPAHIVLAALQALVRRGDISVEAVASYIDSAGIDADKPAASAL